MWCRGKEGGAEQGTREAEGINKESRVSEEGVELDVIVDY